MKGWELGAEEVGGEGGVEFTLQFGPGDKLAVLRLEG